VPWPSVGLSCKWKLRWNRRSPATLYSPRHSIRSVACSSTSPPAPTPDRALRHRRPRGSRRARRPRRTLWSGLPRGGFADLVPAADLCTSPPQDVRQATAQRPRLPATQGSASQQVGDEPIACGPGSGVEVAHIGIKVATVEAYQPLRFERLLVGGQCFVCHR
jgi:hypothetical protein